MAHLTLIVGGVRSGKSRFAEDLAAGLSPVCYLATAQRWSGGESGDGEDKEMLERIARHRQHRAERFPNWQTVEENWDVPGAVSEHGSKGCVLVECLTLWVTNLLMGDGQHRALSKEDVLSRMRKLAEAARRVPARVIVVSNEVGWGVIPENALARSFADILGEANQQLAASAEEVYACMAGIPMRLKPG